MSGTSLDGLDLCFATFSLSNESWSYKINRCKTLEYSDYWVNKLKNAQILNAEDLVKLDHEYGVYLGKQAKEFITSIELEPDLIASHGHTVFHNPKLNFTKQIGNGAQLAVSSGFKTCCDFRTTDVALGGQGAPLVPIGDLKLFPNFNACLNLGGFSNISIKEESMLAFDICPTNIVLNKLANELGKEFDKSGAIARRGSINLELLQELNSLNYYNLIGPKSLGREWVEEKTYPILNKYDIKTKDKLHTYCVHISAQIKNVVKFANITDKILVTGGGVKNDFLMESFENEGLNITIPNLELIDFKEALIFAFLGLLRFIKIPNTLSSVTGARKDSISGCIYLP
jgi:anhydro-N-acetylmuramic acid kinase